jgi:O-methyltransferase/8-demethyl-8-(2,3-dimethoxy-alpha-L-rhamnosyl)tetracenomycin-C 4'-O-methyltransferase
MFPFARFFGERRDSNQPASRIVVMGNNLYLDLIEKCLLGTIYEDAPNDFWSVGKFDAATRAEGKDWPSQAHSMIGGKRLRNLRVLCEQALREQIPGDFIETGVWRGGACILMRAVLKAYEENTRRVWAADSFEGLPMPEVPQDAGDKHHTYQQLAVSLEQVQDNFKKYGLLDNQVVFLKGWFKDTLKPAPIERLAVLRLDGDMYQSTMDSLESLYHKVSTGGFIIVDDYALPGCRAAITEFRGRQKRAEPLVEVDWSGVYWRKF